MVPAALGEAVWSELVVLDYVECAIDGTVICVLADALSLLLLEVDFVNTEMSAVAEDII